MRSLESSSPMAGVVGGAFMGLFSLPFVLCGLGALVFSLGMLYSAWKKGKWVATPMEYFEASPNKEEGTEGAYYRYRYQGREYTNTNPRDTGMFSQLQESLGGGHRERGDECYVNPQNPSESVLAVPNPGYAPWFSGLFALTHGAAGFGLGIAGLMNLRRGLRSSKLSRSAPGEPWKWREDWARNEARADVRSWHFALGYISVILLLIGGFSVAVYFGPMGSIGQKIGSLAILAAGAGAAWLTLKFAARSKLTSHIHLEFPERGLGVGEVSTLRLHGWHGSEAPKLSLRARRITRHGKRTIVDHLYETPVAIEGMRRGDSWSFPVEIHAGAPIMAPEFPEITWSAEVYGANQIISKATFPVPVYRRSAEVPVVSTPPPGFGAMSTLPATPPTALTNEQAKQVLEGEGIMVADLGGVLSVLIPKGRKSVSGAFTAIFALILGVIGVVSWINGGGFLGRFVAAPAALWFLHKAAMARWADRELQMDATTLTCRMVAPWIKSRKSYPKHVIQSVETHTSGSMNDVPYFHVAVRLTGGALKRISGDFDSENKANALVLIVRDWKDKV